jgi:hypothetical protein
MPDMFKINQHVLFTLYVGVCLSIFVHIHNKTFMLKTMSTGVQNIDHVLYTRAK